VLPHFQPTSNSGDKIFGYTASVLGEFGVNTKCLKAPLYQQFGLETILKSTKLEGQRVALVVHSWIPVVQISAIK